MVKLQPKKAVAASSPAERKLMEELEQMKVGPKKHFYVAVLGDLPHSPLLWLKRRVVV